MNLFLSFIMNMMFSGPSRRMQKEVAGVGLSHFRNDYVCYHETHPMVLYRIQKKII